jgi:ABC-2 type transport system ATP-binding protein
MSPIEARGLTKRFSRVTAVDGVTFSVRPGEVTGFLGRNGAGKTTTLRMILGLERPTSGTVTVDGRPYAHLVAPLRHVGSLLDARAVQPGCPATEHLLALARSNGIERRRVGEVLETVGLGEVARKSARTFSLGMLQRLGLAAALLGDPPILVFDEPLNGLDPEGIIWFRGLTRQMAAEGRTILVSSHLMTEMAVTADHLLIIGEGRLLVDSEMKTFEQDHEHEEIRVRTADPQALRGRVTPPPPRCSASGSASTPARPPGRSRRSSPPSGSCRGSAPRSRNSCPTSSRNTGSPRPAPASSRPDPIPNSSARGPASG